MRMRTAWTMATCALLCMSCSDDPRDAVESRPASIASNRAAPSQSAPSGTSPLEAGQATVEAPAVMVAQIGRKLAANGLLQEPITEFPTSAPIYGLAIFKGLDNQDGEVVLQIFDSADRQVFNHLARYVVHGETPVGFNVKSAGEPWDAGNYRALFVCNGKPCWEIKFMLK